MIRSPALFFLGLLLGSAALPAESPSPLVLGAADVRVLPQDDGWHLFIRAKPGLGSVLLSESHELPDHKIATYSWRALEPNAVNGTEKRVLDGAFLKQPNLYLISSTPVKDPLWGKAFEVLIPPVMEYGSRDAPNGRYGKLDVQAELSRPHGTVWFSIRAFSKPYEDYTGEYHENPFELSSILVVQSPALDHAYYVKGNEDLFHRLGHVFKARDAAAGAQFVKTLFQANRDLVICLDLTMSMVVDLKALQSELLPGLADRMKTLDHFRLGLVEYKDYGAPFVTKPFPLTSDPAAFISEVNHSVAAGGGDVPEAVIEALNDALKLFPADAKVPPMIVIFGDAPQHDSPRGKIKESDVMARARALGVDVETVLLPVTQY